MFKSKEEKQEAKREKYMKKYHLDNLSEKDMEIIQEISSNSAKIASTVGMLTMDSKEQAKLLQLESLVAQNWLIIRKLDEISQN